MMLCYQKEHRGSRHTQRRKRNRPSSSYSTWAYKCLPLASVSVIDRREITPFLTSGENRQFRSHGSWPQMAASSSDFKLIGGTFFPFFLFLFCSGARCASILSNISVRYVTRPCKNTTAALQKHNYSIFYHKLHQCFMVLIRFLLLQRGEAEDAAHSHSGVISVNVNVVHMWICNNVRPNFNCAGLCNVRWNKHNVAQGFCGADNANPWALEHVLSTKQCV